MKDKTAKMLKITFGSLVMLCAGIGVGFGISILTNDLNLTSESKNKIYSYDDENKLIDVTEKYIDKDVVLKDYVSRKNYLEESYLLPKSEFKLNQLYVVVKNDAKSKTQIENKLIEADLNLLTDIKPNDIVKLDINTTKMDTPSNKSDVIIAGTIGGVSFNQFYFVESNSLFSNELNIVVVPKSGKSDIYYLKYKIVDGEFSILSLKFEIVNNKLTFDILTPNIENLVFKENFIFSETKGQNKINVDIVTDEYVSKESLTVGQKYIATEKDGVKDLETFSYSNEYVNINSDGYNVGDIYEIKENTEDTNRKVLVKSNNYLNFDDITTTGLYRKIVDNNVNKISSDLSKLYVKKEDIKGTDIYIKDINDNVKVADKNIVFVKQPTTASHISIGELKSSSRTLNFSSEYFYFYESETSTKELKNFVLERGASKNLYGVFVVLGEDNNSGVLYGFELTISRSAETEDDSFVVSRVSNVGEYRTKDVVNYDTKVSYSSITNNVAFVEEETLSKFENYFVNLKEHVDSKI